MKKKYLYTGLAGIVLAIALFSMMFFRNAEQVYTFETAKVGKGNVSNSITATGTLEAIKTVQVGTQVSGVIEKIYADFNSQVKKGQLLAQLDETPLQAQLDQSKAAVDQADAQVKYQKATYERYKALIAKKLIAQSDYDLAEFNYNNAVAALKNAKSVYDKNRINLSYARIYSPIDGVVLNRAVDEGQTVAASFNTPTLFSIANDLTRMRVEAKVDEADIGQVKPDQHVQFTVDAFPGIKFEGSVSEIRMQPVVTNNVVTYTVILNAPNPDMKLLPGMTANTTIFVNEKNNVLVVPGKAVRFSPDSKMLEAYEKTLPAGISQHAAPAVQSATSGHTGLTAVWTKNGPVLAKKEVSLGMNDGINYEVLSGLNQGDEIVLSMSAEKATAETKKAARSPFMPQRPGQKK